MSEKKEYFIGIDVQVKRACPYAVMDGANEIVEQGWIKSTTLKRTITVLVERYPDSHFAVDAPRMPIKKLRPYYWGRDGWRSHRLSDKGLGRHCEVVIASHKLGRPQWTPLSQSVPDWMKLGFRFFKTIEKLRPCYEVFPSVSYQMLNDTDCPNVSFNFNGFLPGPKDMLDAMIAALTVKEFLAGNGMEVGGGDEKGTIILPRKINKKDLIKPVLKWPKGL